MHGMNIKTINCVLRLVFYRVQLLVNIVHNVYKLIKAGFTECDPLGYAWVSHSARFTDNERYGILQISVSQTLLQQDFLYSRTFSYQKKIVNKETSWAAAERFTGSC